MPNDLDSEETTIVATYSTRRDAELARDVLGDADIHTFVRTDDAGGMHPQMQRPNGVKLVGLRRSAQRAHDLLDDANLLPEGPPATAPDATGDTADDLGSLVYGVVVLLGVGALLLVLLMIVWG